MFRAFWLQSIAQCALVVISTSFALAHDGEDNGGIGTGFESEVEVQIADDFRGKSEIHYYVKDRKGKRKELEFPAAMKKPNLVTGQRIRVDGHVHSNKPSSILLDKEVLALDGASTSSTATPVAAALSGERNVIAVITEFTDAAVSCSDDAVSNTLFAAAPAYSVKNFYQETSRSQLTVQGQVLRVKLAKAMGTTCDPFNWMNEARLEAAKQISLSGFQHTLIVLPSNAPCGFSGLGSLGGGQTWVKTCSNGSIYAHELGHNFNMHHAANLSWEYGDTSDVMGTSYAPVNALHSLQLGWTPASNVLDVKSSGTYRITSLETSPLVAASPQVLKVFKPDTNEYYYLSMREASGAFASKYLPSTFINRLSVHKWSGEKTQLLGSKGLVEEFVDATNAITISPVSLNGNQLDVQIQLTGTCVRKPPTIYVQNPASILPGQSATVAVGIQNNDSYYCEASTFNLNATAASELGISLSAQSLTIQPGKSASYQVAVTTASTILTGTYSGSTGATDTLNSSRSVAAPFTVTVGTQTRKSRGRRNR